MFIPTPSRPRFIKPRAPGEASGHFISVLEIEGGKRSKGRKSRRAWYQRVLEGYRRSTQKGKGVFNWSAPSYQKDSNTPTPISEGVLEERIVLFVRKVDSGTSAVLAFRNYWINDANVCMAAAHLGYSFREENTHLFRDEPDQVHPIYAKRYFAHLLTPERVASELYEQFGQRLVAGKLSDNVPDSLWELRNFNPFRNFVAQNLGIALESKVESDRHTKPPSTTSSLRDDYRPYWGQ